MSFTFQLATDKGSQLTITLPFLESQGPNHIRMQRRGHAREMAQFRTQASLSLPEPTAVAFLLRHLL
jgi:hypothetical protein